MLTALSVLVPLLRSRVAHPYRGNRLPRRNAPTGQTMRAESPSSSTAECERSATGSSSGCVPRPGMAGFGADRPIRRRSTNAEDCPIADIQRRHPDGVDGWKLVKALDLRPADQLPDRTARHRASAPDAVAIAQRRRHRSPRHGSERGVDPADPCATPPDPKSAPTETV